MKAKSAQTQVSLSVLLPLVISIFSFYLVFLFVSLYCSALCRVLACCFASMVCSFLLICLFGFVRNATWCFLLVLVLFVLVLLSMLVGVSPVLFCSLPFRNASVCFVVLSLCVLADILILFLCHCFPVSFSRHIHTLLACVCSLDALSSLFRLFPYSRCRASLLYSSSSFFWFTHSFTTLCLCLSLSLFVFPLFAFRWYLILAFCIIKIVEAFHLDSRFDRRSSKLWIWIKTMDCEKIAKTEARFRKSEWYAKKKEKQRNTNFLTRNSGTHNFTELRAVEIRRENRNRKSQLPIYSLDHSVKSARINEQFLVLLLRTMMMVVMTILIDQYNPRAQSEHHSQMKIRQPDGNKGDEQHRRRRRSRWKSMKTMEKKQWNNETMPYAE